MKTLRNAMRSFARDEKGNLLAELVLVLPFFLWSYLALFVYWDAYRSMNTVQKATYTVSDMISREMVPVSATYLNGLRNVMDYMLDADQDVRMRVTSVTWNALASRFEVQWSYSPNNAMTPHTNATLLAHANRIPNMSDGDTVVIVETEVDYIPSFNVGVGDQTFEQFIVTRPRFVPRVCFDGVPCA